MSQINNAYIDELHIVAGSDSNGRFTGHNNSAFYNLICERDITERGSFTGYNGIATSGYQWVMQITNKLSSSITFGSTDFLEIHNRDFIARLYLSGDSIVKKCSYWASLDGITLGGYESLYIGSNNLLHNTDYVPANVPNSRKINSLSKSDDNGLQYSSASSLTIPLESDKGLIIDYIKNGGYGATTVFAIINTTPGSFTRILSDVIGNFNDAVDNTKTEATDLANISAVLQALYYTHIDGWYSQYGSNVNINYANLSSGSIQRPMNSNLDPINASPAHTQPYMYDSYWTDSGTYDWNTRWIGSKTINQNYLNKAADQRFNPNNFYIDQLYLGTNRLETGNNVFNHNGMYTGSYREHGGYPYVIQLTNSSAQDSIISNTSYIKFDVKYKTAPMLGHDDTEANIYLTSVNNNITIPSNESIYLYSNVSGSKILPSDLTITDIGNRAIEIPFLLPDWIPNPTDPAPYSNTKISLEAGTGEIWDAGTIDVATANSILWTKTTFYPYIGSMTSDYIDIGNATLISNIVNSNTTDYAIWRRDITSTYPNPTFSTNDWERIGDDINSAEASGLNASATGDPHITTVNGEYYKFDYLGAFRLYEDNDLIINGLSELGDATRWEDKQYIRKVFIQYQDKSILIDTGFRGTPAKILENNGFENTDEELEFNQLAEVNCWQCRKTYNILEKGFINRHRNKYGHKILDPIRNKITIELENFKFEIFNVNEYNLQPCRFNFSKLDNDYSQSKGCLIERKYVGVSILKDIKDISKIVEIDVNNNNDLVELYSTVEMNVELIDPKFI